ncbi:hypothetical protein [Fructilactobacillus cliffordii]|uniref:Uncharacterized protein n=1 Tax=Fructilactobacillus cliffordii TaxID=2940299 RepID=A0A9Q8ZUL2_9LACO|nr:hypothetical protein [Fructilactobacillus cliffordii]USS89894.1 hypothetical protein M3M40_03750 [Fructilactobacillus cliffordii]
MSDSESISVSIVDSISGNNLLSENSQMTAISSRNRETRSYQGTSLRSGASESNQLALSHNNQSMINAGNQTNSGINQQQTNQTPVNLSQIQQLFANNSASDSSTTPTRRISRSSSVQKKVGQQSEIGSSEQRNHSAVSAKHAKQSVHNQKGFVEKAAEFGALGTIGLLLLLGRSRKNKVNRKK